MAMAAHQPPVVGVVEMAPGTVDGSLLFPLTHPSPSPWCHNVQSAQWRQGHPAPRIRCRLLQHGGGPRQRQRRRANPGAHHEDLGGGNRGNSCSERSQWHGHFRRGGSPGDVHARPAGRRRPGKDEEEEPEADYDRDLSPEPESRAGETRAGETSHGTPDIDMEPLPGGEEAAFPEPEQEGPPSAERLLILRALGGMRVSEKGQINVEDVGWNLMPWNLLMNICKEVAKEMQLDMSSPFGYAATQACLTKYRSLVWTACEKSKEGRWWMTKWPWQVVDQPRRPEPGPGDLNAHQQKNVMKVSG